jgi:FkbM family methyltransferase
MIPFARRLGRFARSMAYVQVWRLLCALAPGKLALFTIDKETGAQVRYPLKSQVGVSLFQSDFELAELSFVRRHLKPGTVFLDVGANAGIFTVLAGKRVGATGRVHAFEPGEAAQSLLRQNIALNRLSNVTVYEGAVSNHCGMTKLAVAQDTALSSLAKTEHPNQSVKECRDVPVITLDEYVAQKGIQRVDLIKIDVEGAEKWVFEGADRLLTSTPGLTILFEAFELNARGFNYSTAEFLEGLLKRGFRLSSLDEKAELVPITQVDKRHGTDIYNFVLRT